MTNGVVETRLTNYDAFHNLESSINDANLRHLLEGSIIIASPSISNPRGVVKYVDFDNTQYKLQIATTVRDKLLFYSKDSSTAEKSIKEFLSLPIMFSYFKNNKRDFTLPGVVAKIYNDIDDNTKILLCEALGKDVEQKIKHLYKNRGYETNINKRPRNVGKYLRSEYDFLTRVTAKIYNQFA